MAVASAALAVAISALSEASCAFVVAKSALSEAIPAFVVAVVAALSAAVLYPFRVLSSAFTSTVEFSRFVPVLFQTMAYPALGVGKVKSKSLSVA